MNVLAIDQGTSATKALVIAPDHRVLGEGVAPVAPRPGPEGAVEQDPGELLESILTAGRAAIADAGEGVAAIGLGNQGETVLAWNRRTGEPKGPAVSWQDRRAAATTESLRDDAETLREITGLPLDPYFAAPKMRWLSSRLGAELDSDDVITTIDAWTTQRLTGAYVTDAATASRTMLLDLGSGGWSPEACGIFDLDPTALPEVRACNAVAGECGAFGPSVPVTALVVDQQAALFAESCFERGQAKCTYGTGAFLLAGTGNTDTRSAAGLATSVAWRLGERLDYCLDGQVYAAGAAVSWLTRLGLIGEPGEIDRRCGESGESGGALFVPALAGLAAPRWRPDARAAWTGLSLASTASDLVAAVIRGIAAEIASLGRAIGEDLGAPLTALRVDGGLTKSSALMQAQADLLQVPVELYPFPDATALGVGAMARLGLEPGRSLGEAVGNWAPSRVFEPSISADEATSFLARFDRAASAMGEL